MKMRKFLSIGAAALALVSCTSIGASAEEVLKGKNYEDTQLHLMIQKSIGGQNVINGLEVNSKTPLGNYLKDPAIAKINEVLSKAGIKATVSANDSYNDVILYVAAQVHGLSAEEKSAKLDTIKDELTLESGDYEGMSDEDLLNTFNSYLQVEKYGSLKLYTNMDGARTVSLEGTNGHVILQVSKESLKALKNKIGDDLSADHINQLLKDYAPQYADKF